jgi:hypothetical protein
MISIWIYDVTKLNATALNAAERVSSQQFRQNDDAIIDAAIKILPKWVLTDADFLNIIVFQSAKTNGFLEWILSRYTHSILELSWQSISLLISGRWSLTVLV